MVNKGFLSCVIVFASRTKKNTHNKIGVLKKIKIGFEPISQSAKFVIKTHELRNRFIYTRFRLRVGFCVYQVIIGIKHFNNSIHIISISPLDFYYDILNLRLLFLKCIIAKYRKASIA